MPGDDDAFVDGRTLRATMAQAGQSLAPWLQQTVELAASTAYGLAEREYDKEFKRYGPEIQGELAKLPKAGWTLDNIRTIVKYVRGNHLDELADERARQLVAGGESSFRAQGGSGLPPSSSGPVGLSLESEALPAEYRAILAKTGMTMDTVKEFCRGYGMTLDQWFAQAQKWGTAVITETPRGALQIERGS